MYIRGCHFPVSGNIAYICSATVFTDREMLFYGKWLCLVQVAGAGNTRMLQPLVNTQCLYPSRNVSSTAAAMAEATDDSNEHDHKGSAQCNEQRHVS